jgi:hypothetical protein
MDLQEVGGGCEDWMEFAQGRDRWRALVSTVMNLRVPKMQGLSLAHIFIQKARTHTKCYAAASPHRLLHF